MTSIAARSPRLWAGSAALSAAALLLAVVALREAGRVWWCACGSWAPWSGEIWSSHNSQHLFDPYTFTHVLHGVAFYGVLWLALRRIPVAARLAVAIALESVWEVVENSEAVIQRYREATISLDYFGDSVLNSLADVGACVLGFVIASRLRPRWSLALFVVVELVLILWIRDSLLINVLMLIWPIEAIKAWQAGS